MFGLSDAQSKTSVRVTTLVIRCICLCVEINRDFEKSRDAVCVGVHVFRVLLSVRRELICTRVVRICLGQILFKQVVLTELLRINARLGTVSLWCVCVCLFSCIEMNEIVKCSEVRGTVLHPRRERVYLGTKSWSTMEETYVICDYGVVLLERSRAVETAGRLWIFTKKPGLGVRNRDESKSGGNHCRFHVFLLLLSVC